MGLQNFVRRIDYLHKQTSAAVKIQENRDKIKRHTSNNHVPYLVDQVKLFNHNNFLPKGEKFLNLLPHMGQHRSPLLLKFLAKRVHMAVKLILHILVHKYIHQVNSTMLMNLLQILLHSLINQWLRTTHVESSSAAIDTLKPLSDDLPWQVSV